MSFSRSRTFVFDSADADFSAENVEDAFYSTTDSDSNLSSSSESSSSSSSDSDSDDNRDQTVGDILREIAADQHGPESRESRKSRKRLSKRATNSASSRRDSTSRSYMSNSSLVQSPNTISSSHNNTNTVSRQSLEFSPRSPSSVKAHRQSKPKTSGNNNSSTVFENDADHLTSIRSLKKPDHVDEQPNNSNSPKTSRRPSSAKSRNSSLSDDNKYKFWLKSRRSRKSLRRNESDGNSSRQAIQNRNKDNDEYKEEEEGDNENDDDDDDEVDIIKVIPPPKGGEEPPGIMIHSPSPVHQESVCASAATDPEIRVDAQLEHLESTNSSEKTVIESPSFTFTNPFMNDSQQQGTTPVDPGSTVVSSPVNGSFAGTSSLLLPSLNSENNSSSSPAHSPLSPNTPSHYYFAENHKDTADGAAFQFPAAALDEKQSSQHFEVPKSADVVIEEPVGHHSRKARGEKPHFHRSRSGGGDGDSDGDDDNNNSDKHDHSHKNGRKNRKRKRSRRRYSNSVVSATAARRRAGWEPGVDIKTTDVILQSIGSSVTIVDYNKSRYRVVQTEVHPEKPVNPEYEEEAPPETLPGEFLPELEPSSAIPIVSKWWHKNTNSQNASKEPSDDAKTVPPVSMPAVPQAQVPPQYQTAQFSSRVPGKNKDFYNHLDNRPEWSSVRWISVNGLSWETISAISQRFQLHRLAIEDMIDIPQRTKVDMYPSHIFCVLPMHKLINYKPESAAEEKKKHNKWFTKLQEKRNAELEKSELKANMANLFVPANHASTGGMPASKDYKSRDKSSNIDIHNGKSNVSTTAHKKSSRKRSNSQNKFGHGLDQIRRRTLSIASDADSTDSEDSDSELAKPLSTRIADLPNNTIYDWNNPYVANLNKPLYIEKKRPLAQYRRAVGVEQVSLFLTDENTVITFFEHSAADIERPLLARLATKSTMLRESCDPSMLLQAIMDIIVDQVQPVISAYRRRLTELQVDAMVTPTMSHTQDLHFMAAELSLLRNNIVPITSLIQSLRDLGDSSTVVPTYMPAQQPSADAPPQYEFQKSSNYSGSNVLFMPTSASPQPQYAQTQEEQQPQQQPKLGNSRISPVAKIYLADVADHLMSYTLDLDVMRGNTKNIIDMIFNVISIQSSDGVNQLSLVSVVFMPLSFWTAVFGMNFDPWPVLEYDVQFYWKLSIPFSIAVMCLVMLTTITQWGKNATRYWKKRWAKHQRRLEKKMEKKAKKKN